MNIRLRILAGIVVVVASLPLAGCSALSGAASQDEAMTQSQYFANLRSELPQLAGSSDTTLRTAGNLLCGNFAPGNVVSGTPWAAAISMLQDTPGLSDAERGVWITAAVKTYCPQYISDLNLR